MSRMKANEILDSWVEKRSAIKVGDDFADRVMAGILTKPIRKKYRIHIYEKTTRLIEIPYIKAMLIFCSVLLGFARLLWTFRVALGC